MTHSHFLHADIEKSLSGTSPDLLSCLLLIRYLCAVPDAEQSCDNVLTPHDRKALWHKIVNEAYKKNGQILSIIKCAIDQITYHLPFAPDFSMYLNSLDDTDECTLRIFVQQLARLPADSDILSSIFKYSPRNMYTLSHSSGDFYTPKQVVRWMTELLEIEHDGSVYDPCCGSGALLCGAALSHPDKTLRLYGQSLDLNSFSICQMNLILQGRSVNLGKHPANTLLNDMHSGRFFDYILTNPPFNSPDWCESSTAYGNTRWLYGYPPQKNANFAWLQHILSHLSPTGRAVTLLPNGTLTTRNLAEQKIRKQILNDGWVEAIFTLPPGLFFGTRIPCCAWVINRDIHRNTVLFVDARQLDFSEQLDRQKTVELLQRYRKHNHLNTTEWSAAASIEEIMHKEYILSPNLYTRPQELSIPPFQQLSDAFAASADALCSRISSPALCASIQKWKATNLPQEWNELYLPDVYTIKGGVAAKKKAFGQGLPMADVKTVIHHMFLPETLSAHVQLPEKDALRYDLRAGDILLNRTSETIEELACCSAVLKNCSAVYGAYLKRLRPKDITRIDSRYAAAYFRSRIYRQEVQRVSFVYTTRANMNLQQLSMIRLYVPSQNWQLALGKTLHDVVHFGQKHSDKDLDAAIHRFAEAFIEKFITYPISLFQKERDHE